MANYVRTAAGTAAVTNPRVFLPTRMRALLARVDGQASSLESLQGLAPSDIESMLESLRRVGYVDVVGSGEASAPVVQSESPARELSGSPSNANATVLNDDAVPRAIALMSDFVWTHLSSEALEILFALEGLSTLAQLRAGLAPYRNRVVLLGPVGSEHLRELNALLGMTSTSS